jgi:hypothetical protein
MVFVQSHANRVKVHWSSQIPSTIFSINRRTEEGTVQYGLKYKVYKKLETLLTVDFEVRQLHVMLAHWRYFSVAALQI